jgi:hypothetical protein
MVRFTQLKYRWSTCLYLFIGLTTVCGIVQPLMLSYLIRITIQHLFMRKWLGTAGAEEDEHKV